MSQVTQITIDNVAFGTFRSNLNDTLSALNTTQSGTSRPSSAVAGTIWLDTTTAASPTLKYYDGADDISLATLDHSANTVNWLDSAVSVAGLTTTATGTVLTLQDTNIEVSGGSTQGGEIRFKEDSDTGSNYTALKAGNPASNVTFTLPIADGTSGQAITTDGSGALAFSSVSADADNYFATSGLSSKDLGVGLHIKSADSSATVSGDADELVIENGSASNMGMTLLSATNGQGHIMFGDSGDNDIGFIAYNHDDNSMKFRINASERLRIISTGNLCYGKTGDSFGTAGQIFYDESGSEGAVQFTSVSGIVPLSLNRLGDDGELLGFFQAGSKEGNVSVSGSTVSYNTFCGTHWSRLADNSKPTILRGTVMDSIATMMTWYQAVAEVAESTDEDGTTTPAHQVKESISLPNGKSVGDAVTFTSQGKEYTGKYVKEDNEQLPMCKISDTEESKGVYGVFMDWDDQDDGLDGDVNDMYVASLGAFVVRIHKDETVAIGDYLQSKGDGTAKVQADDILRASTIAKVISTEKTHIYDDGSYCVPCTLHCG